MSIKIRNTNPPCFATDLLHCHAISQTWLHCSLLATGTHLDRTQFLCQIFISVCPLTERTVKVPRSMASHNVLSFSWERRKRSQISKSLYLHYKSPPAHKSAGFLLSLEAVFRASKIILWKCRNKGKKVFVMRGGSSSSRAAGSKPYGTIIFFLLVGEYSKLSSSFLNASYVGTGKG